MLRDGYTYPSVVEEGELIPEAYLHDERMLPHRLSGDIAKIFPRAVPAEDAGGKKKPKICWRPEP